MSNWSEMYMLLVVVGTPMMISLTCIPKTAKNRGRLGWVLGILGGLSGLVVGLASALLANG